MKKCLVPATLLLAIGLMGSTALAQSPSTTDASAGVKTGKSAGKSGGKSHNSSGRADAELADLSQNLSLTDDQKAKIKPILDDQSTQIHTLKKDTTLSKDDQKTRSKTIRDASSQKIRALLTPDQQKTFDGISKKGSKKKEAPAPTPGA
jgi:Spy/CpxP family protein refolding chaperone